MTTGYWESIRRARASRRRVLIGGSSLAAAAALLAACGGSDSGGGTKEEGSGMLSKPVDTSAQAKQGGVVKDFQTQDPLHFDVLSSNSLAGVVGVAGAFAYPRLLKYTMPKYPKAADGTIEGDLAESHEVSADGLTITMKIRQNLKWDSRAPTSGRVIDAQDVVFSWDRYTKLNPSAGDLAYDATKSPTSAVETVTAPDKNTVVIKLHRPDSSVLPLFAESNHFYVFPREAESGFDPKKDIRGYGPWILDSFSPSVSMVWKRNPDYYVKGRPFAETWERPIITEYNARLAQFRAGSIYTSVVTQEDVVQTKKDLPKTVLQQQGYFPAGGQYLSFGYEGDSAFKDQRVRQALSMLVEPDGFANAIENTGLFESNGLPVTIGRNTVLYAGWGPYWLDPTNSKAFGDSAKYLNYDPAASKALLSAAGLSNGVDITFTYDTTQYAQPYGQIAQIFAGMLTAGGFRIKQNPLPYNDYYNNYFLSYVNNGKGFSGMILRNGRSFPTAAAQYSGQVHPAGGVFHGAPSTADGKNAGLGDPKVNAWIEQMKAEFDVQKQQAISHDIIKYYTSQAYTIPRPTSSQPFTVTWPALSNVGADSQWFAESSVYTRLNWWVDATKAPLGNS